MKKRTKITLRTKIYLTIVGLLALTGVFYAATPIFFTTFNQPVGLFGTQFEMFGTEFNTQNFNSIDCMGNVTTVAQIPDNVSNLAIEKYIAIAPTQSANATPAWNPGDKFVTQGNAIYKLSGGSFNLFSFIVGCSQDHGGITFDKTGNFGFNMIVLCQSGGVWEIDANGNQTLLANITTSDEIEGPGIPPTTFGPFGGQILIADETSGRIFAVSNTGVVTPNALGVFWPAAEGVVVIPDTVCTFGCATGGFFNAYEGPDQVIQYPPSDFTGLGGNILITSEGASGTALVKFNAVTQKYDLTFFDNPHGGGEQAFFVECGISPTPSPSPTATATATATATVTPTPTPTPSGVCPLTQGYWKNHPDAWPVHSLMLGSQTYNMTELLAILNNPGKGDASTILAVQLIAAKLNIANGSDPTPVSTTITHADSLLSMFSGKLPYNVKTSSAIGQMMVSDANTLDNYNNGKLTQHCSP